MKTHVAIQRLEAVGYNCRTVRDTSNGRLPNSRTYDLVVSLQGQDMQRLRLKGDNVVLAGDVDAMVKYLAQKVTNK